ncbi:MAG: GIY-YIG nuclease family protein [Patescibacteria group bacterium]|nr:GIY-YIG nuclease family protein [Patescibacteria group bacterium]
MPYAYIFRSINFQITYVDSASQTLQERLDEHNKGFTAFTNKFKPWKLIYSEKFASLEEARFRKKYLKNAAGRRFIKKNNIIRE